MFILLSNEIKSHENTFLICRIIYFVQVVLYFQYVSTSECNYCYCCITKTILTSICTCIPKQRISRKTNFTLTVFAVFFLDILAFHKIFFTNFLLNKVDINYFYIWQFIKLPKLIAIKLQYKSYKTIYKTKVKVTRVNCYLSFQ